MGRTSTQPESIHVNGLSYSPALLLDAHLSASITDNPAFSSGCADGFGGYIDTVSDFGMRFRRCSEVRRFVRGCVFEKYRPSHFDSCSWLSWRIGYVLGWLSALACVQYQEAKAGLGTLTDVVAQFEQRARE